MKEALTKKLLFMPRWAWLVLLIGSGYLYYRYRQNQAATQADNLPQDQYGSYNTAGTVSSAQQLPDAYGGTYPVSGGGAFGGGAFPFFQSPPNPPSNSGTPLPPAQGATTVNIFGGPGSGGSRGHHRAHTPTRKDKDRGRHHPHRNKETSTGGDRQSDRYEKTHTKKPRAGTYKVKGP